MSSALMYIIFAGSNISLPGSTIIFPGTLSNPLILNNTIQIPSISPTVNEPTSTPASEIQTRRPDYTEFPSISPTVNEPTSTPASGIQTRRPDYTYTPGIGGHKVHTQPVIWSSAQRICEQEGGYLAIINSHAESQVLVELFRKTGRHSASANGFCVLIGFHDRYQEGQYVTVHGESLVTAGFNEWMDGGPDDSNNEDCGSMYKDGKLNDISCDISVGFVCEVPFT